MPIYNSLSFLDLSHDFYLGLFFLGFKIYVLLLLLFFFLTALVLHTLECLEIMGENKLTQNFTI